jgi:hypothetical protein
LPLQTHGYRTRACAISRIRIVVRATDSDGLICSIENRFRQLLLWRLSQVCAAFYPGSGIESHYWNNDFPACSRRTKEISFFRSFTFLCHGHYREKKWLFNCSANDVLLSSQCESLPFAGFAGRRSSRIPLVIQILVAGIHPETGVSVQAVGETLAVNRDGVLISTIPGLMSGMRLSLDNAPSRSKWLS